MLSRVIVRSMCRRGCFSFLRLIAFVRASIPFLIDLLPNVYVANKASERRRKSLRLRPDVSLADAIGRIDKYFKTVIKKKKKEKKTDSFCLETIDIGEQIDEWEQHIGAYLCSSSFDPFYDFFVVMGLESVKDDSGCELISRQLLVRSGT